MIDYSVCIAGWTFKEDVYKLAPEKSFAVCHREGDTCGVSKKIIPNVGMDWRKYDYYLKNIWDRKSNVFFFQDDLDIIEPSSLLDELYEKIYDSVDYITQFTAVCKDLIIFTGHSEQIKALHPRGRAFYCSVEFLNYLLLPRKRKLDVYNGFWWDNTVATQREITLDLELIQLAKVYVEFSDRRHWSYVYVPNIIEID